MQTLINTYFWNPNVNKWTVCGVYRRYNGEGNNQKCDWVKLNEVGIILWVISSRVKTEQTGVKKKTQGKFSGTELH